MIAKPEWALRAESIPTRQGYPTRDKWGPGPWQEEPDLVEWRDAATGYPCLIVRGPMGALCGYVGLPPGHPLHGMAYQACDDRLEVHGGLTFADACDEGGHICHVAQPGEPDQVWWLGFDCNHAGDYDPAGQALVASLTGGTRWKDEFSTYKPIAYVRSECAQLAAQLAAVTP